MPNIWVILIIVLSSLIKGLTGFGFALLSFPLLLMLYTPKEIIPVLMMCNLVASTFIVLQKKDTVLLNKTSFYLIGAGGVFTIAGVLALHSFHPQILIRLAGIFFIALTLYSFLKKPKTLRKLPLYLYVSAGAIIGFITGAISISGPPLALFLNRANVNNRQFREIFAWFSVITATIAIIGYHQTGMLTLNTLKTALVFTPILLFGSILGKRFNTRLSTTSFQTINTVLTLISSILLVFR